ncbi:transglycosylase domain-containing protein [Bifidobacterium pullorum]|uniref:transglycosylase domain-containing protein n=2 Tax=Bifidobacterium pullorum TaxID=78448 RepID=UPI0025A3C9B1|nr:transglycosylase domain-containing protein [Bifidobacterium pullorum]MDM8323106.1 transglycosylase domain-containing protein [Bifidobacterium pullorum]
MPKKKSMTIRRALSLVLAYIVLCVTGGVVASLLFVPAVFGANTVAKAVIPSLQVEGIDFDVTSLPQQSRMYASDGSLIATFYSQNRVVVPIKDVSEYMQKAIVAREDRRFFEHSGVDVQGVMRAFIQTYVLKRDMQGGSSLTQQYVKNVLMVQAREDNDPIAEYHAQESTIARKLREMLIAVQMEKMYSKPEILQGYLNIAQFGSNNLYGVETAAQRYFNVHAKDLNLVQSATIAAITKNPAGLDPSIPENQEDSENERNIVLKLMLDQGLIEQAEYDEAVNIPLVDTLNIQSVNQGCQSAGNAAFFCSYVTTKILNSEEFGETEADRQKLLNEGGLDIYTTMDVNANNAAMQAANDTIPASDPSGMEVMIAAIKPGTGEVLGFGINRTYDATDAAASDQTKTSMNYMVDQVDGGGWGVQVGSTWKPINMVAWMQQGRSINEGLRTSTSYPLSSFSCNNYSFANTNWKVENSGGGTVSPETPLQGLIRSHNTTQASMASQIGLCAIADAAKALGYHNSPASAMDVYSDNSFNAPMTIGTVQASPLTMANVYATLGANGVACTPIAMTKVTDKDGNEIKVPSADCHQAIDPEIAQTVAYAMNQGVVTAGGEAATTQLDNGRKTFAKTGTNEQTYMLTAGFVPNTVAAFVAVADAQDPINNTFEYKTINGVYHDYWYGMYIATPAWKQFMNTYLDAIDAPIDNDYGTPAQKYLTVTGVQASTSNNQNNQNQQQNQQQSQGQQAQQDQTQAGQQAQQDQTQAGQQPIA